MAIPIPLLRIITGSSITFLSSVWLLPARATRVSPKLLIAGRFVLYLKVTIPESLKPV